MRNLVKVIISLCLLIVFLIACFVSISAFLIGGWLHTYKVFTQKKLVAVVEVGEEKVDEDGLEYFDVTYKAVDDKSALIIMFSPGSKKDKQFAQSQDYTVYGDHIEVGGEIIKFNDFWQLFNLRNIYKVTRLEGDYSDIEKAKSLSGEKRSIFALNGGTDEYWRHLQEREEDYDYLVDSVFGNFSTKFVQDEPREYGLYITEDGFILDSLNE